MIILPDNWAELLQFRSFMDVKNENKYEEVGLIILILINDHKQVMAYEQALVDPSRSTEGKWKTLNEATLSLKVNLPESCSTALVSSIKDNFKISEEALDQNWQFLEDKTLKKMKDVLYELWCEYIIGKR